MEIRNRRRNYMRKTIRFGIIGCGLMGREFASASARWCHLTADIPRPEIVGICDTNESSHKWFVDNFPSIQTITTDYKACLLYTSDAADDLLCVDLGGRRIIKKK